MYILYVRHDIQYRVESRSTNYIFLYGHSNVDIFLRISKQLWVKFK